MNIIVNFETAKFLKDVKGFEPESKAFYDGSGELFYYNYSNNVMQRFRYAAPTIAEVLMWIYEKYGILISVDAPHRLIKKWCFDVYKINDEITLNQTSYFNSPKEAYEAAIEYTLNNLI